MRTKIKTTPEGFLPLQKRNWFSRWKPIWYMDVRLPGGPYGRITAEVKTDNGHYTYQINYWLARQIERGFWRNRKQLKRDREIRKCR